MNYNIPRTGGVEPMTYYANISKNQYSPHGRG